MEMFLLQKNDDNFVIEPVASGQGKIMEKPYGYKKWYKVCKKKKRERENLEKINLYVVRSN